MTAPMRWSDIADLYREYHPRLYAYIYRRVIRHGESDELANDLCSETFVKAIEAMCSGHGPHSDVSGWLHRIAHNLVVDEYKRRWRRGTPISLDDLVEMPHEALTPHDEVVSAIGCDVIEGAVERLKGLQAIIVTMQADGYTGGEMGALVGKSEGAAKALLHRARVQLRHDFTEKGYEASIEGLIPQKGRRI